MTDHHAEQAIDETADHPHPMPLWATWSLWVVVVAALVIGAAEWPKRLWLQPSRHWISARRTRDKQMMLAPLLMVIGAALGTPTYLAAGLLESPTLAAILGAGTGVLAAPLYDATVGTIALIPRIVRARAGVETTQAVPAVEDTLDIPREDIER